MAREYRLSEIEWEEKLPSDWDEVRAKFIFNNIKEVVGDKWDDYQRISLTYDGVIPRSKIDNEGLNPASLSTYQIVKENNLLFKLIDLENEKTSRVGLSTYEGITSSAYVRVDVKKQYPKFYYYWYYSMWFRYIYNKLGNGVRSTINASQLLNYPVPKPSFQEQEKIAAYLDEKTVKIDELISAQEDAIAKLEEFKKRLISEKVVNGLKKENDFKDTNIDWIGEIPKNYKITRVSRHAFVTKLAGFEFTKILSKKIKEQGEVPIVRAQNIKNDSFIEDFTGYIDIETARLLHRSNLDKSCILMTFIGAGVGEVAIYNKSKLHQLAPNVAKIVINKEDEKLLLLRFLLYYLMSSSAEGEKDQYLKATAQPNISMTIIRSLRIVLPPMNEQIEIVAYLDRKTEEINQLIQIKKNKIEKLNEYKKSLIYEAVTGKVEVM